MDDASDPQAQAVGLLTLLGYICFFLYFQTLRYILKLEKTSYNNLFRYYKLISDHLISLAVCTGLLFFALFSIIPGKLSFFTFSFWILNLVFSILLSKKTRHYKKYLKIWKIISIIGLILTAFPWFVMNIVIIAIISMLIFHGFSKIWPRSQSGSSSRSGPVIVSDSARVNNNDSDDEEYQDSETEGVTV